MPHCCTHTYTHTHSRALSSSCRFIVIIYLVWRCTFFFASTKTVAGRRFRVIYLFIVFWPGLHPPQQLLLHLHLPTLPGHQPRVPPPPAAHFPSCLPLDSLAEDEQVCFATFLRPRKPAIFHCCCCVCPASSASPFFSASPALFFVFILLCPPAQFMRVA